MKKEKLTGQGPALLVVILVCGIAFLCKNDRDRSKEIALKNDAFTAQQQQLKTQLNNLSKRCGGICDAHEYKEKQPDTITLILKEMKEDEKQLSECSNAVEKATQSNSSSFSTSLSVISRSEIHLKSYDNWRHPPQKTPDKPRPPTKPCAFIADLEDLSVSEPKIIRGKITFGVATATTDCRKIKSSSLHFSIESTDGKPIIGINPGNETKLNGGRGVITFEDAKISEDLGGLIIVLKRIKKNNTIEKLYPKH